MKRTIIAVLLMLAAFAAGAQETTNRIRKCGSETGGQEATEFICNCGEEDEVKEAVGVSYEGAEEAVVAQETTISPDKTEEGTVAQEQSELCCENGEEVAVQKQKQVREAVKLPYASGEEAEFAISFQAKMWPRTDMAKLTVDVADDVLPGNVDTYRISAFVRTTIFRWVYKMDTYYTSWIGRDGLPVKASTEINEGTYVYNNDYWYDWDNMRVNMRWSKPGRYDNILDTLAITPNTRDMVSLIYHMRSVDPEAMGVGVDHDIELLNSDAVKHLKYRFLGREVKDIKGFGKLNTLHFSCQIIMRDGTEFDKGNDLHVWLTDDRNKLPLLVESPIRWGSMKARLVSYKNLKFPNDGVLQ